MLKDLKNLEQGKSVQNLENLEKGKSVLNLENLEQGKSVQNLENLEQGKSDPNNDLTKKVTLNKIFNKISSPALGFPTQVDFTWAHMRAL